MFWDIRLTAKSCKKALRLPKRVGEIFQLLLKEIELCGPIMNKWPNYGKLSKNCYHCHLKKGKPTYVAVWRVVNKKEKIVEVVYVGTHEKAHYDQLC